MSPLSPTVGEFLRIGSVAVAAYDYIITLPVEWRLYTSKWPLPFTFNLSNVLFILIRYISIVTIAISNFAFFSGGFTPASCKKFYLLPPALKVLQSMVSQMILGTRAYNISRRSRPIGYFLIVFWIIVTGLQWFTNVYNRVPVQRLGNCTSGNHPGQLIAWVHHLVAVVFDMVTLGLSGFYLLKSAPDMSKMTDLIKMMLYDGLGYFVALTGVNILNMILYRLKNPIVQSSGASFGYTVVWIMSQNLLLHVREAAAERSRLAMLTYDLSTVRDAADAMRSQFVTIPRDDPGRSIDLDVQVQIERSVTVEYDPAYFYRRETYRKPRILWDPRPAK